MSAESRKPSGKYKTSFGALGEMMHKEDELQRWREYSRARRQRQGQYGQDYVTGRVRGTSNANPSRAQVAPAPIDEPPKLKSPPFAKASRGKRKPPRASAGLSSEGSGAGHSGTTGSYSGSTVMMNPQPAVEERSKGAQQALAMRRKHQQLREDEHARKLRSQQQAQQAALLRQHEQERIQSIIHSQGGGAGMQQHIDPTNGESGGNGGGVSAAHGRSRVSLQPIPDTPGFAATVNSHTSSSANGGQHARPTLGDHTAGDSGAGVSSTERAPPSTQPARGVQPARQPPSGFQSPIRLVADNQRSRALAAAAQMTPSLEEAAATAHVTFGADDAPAGAVFTAESHGHETASQHLFEFLGSPYDADNAVHVHQLFATVFRFCRMYQQQLDLNELHGDFMMSLLHRASSLGYKHIAEMFVLMGADIDAKDKRGRTPLMMAASGGYSSTCDMLITYGANVNATCDHGHSALRRAIKNAHVSAARTLLERGADLSVGSPTELRDSGVPMLDLLVEHMPDLALEALDRRRKPLYRATGLVGATMTSKEWEAHVEQQARRHNAVRVKTRHDLLHLPVYNPLAALVPWDERQRAQGIMTEYDYAGTETVRTMTACTVHHTTASCPHTSRAAVWRKR